MNQSEFHRLFLENQRRLFGYILTILPHIDQAEEVFQDTCVVVLDKFKQFEPDSNFMRWACQIAKYEVLNFLRRSNRKYFCIDEADMNSLTQRRLEMGPQLDSRRRALRHCMEKLRDSDRRLVEARYAEKTKSRELAGTLKMRENTVYKALSRIRLALQECINARVAQEEHE